MDAARMGHNGFVEPRTWAWEVAQSQAHAFIKLIIHTLELLVKDGEQAAHVSDERLAALTSLSIKTIRKYRRDAEEQGWFSFSLGDGRGKVTEYRIAIPVDTIKEIAARLDAVAKGYPERETFNDHETQKATPTVVPFREKDTLIGKPFAEEGYPGREPAGDGNFNVPPHPPKDINIKNIIITPSVPQPEPPVATEPKKMARQMPADWRPGPSCIAWAKGEKIGATDQQISDQFDAFRDYHQSRASRFVNWDQAFQTWMRNAKNYGRLNGNHYRPANGSQFRERSLLSDDDPPRKLRPRCEVET